MVWRNASGIGREGTGIYIKSERGMNNRRMFFSLFFQFPSSVFVLGLFPSSFLFLARIPDPLLRTAFFGKIELFFSKFSFNFQSRLSALAGPESDLRMSALGTNEKKFDCVSLGVYPSIQLFNELRLSYFIGKVKPWRKKLMAFDIALGLFFFSF